MEEYKTYIDWWNINKYNEFHKGVELVHPELVQRNMAVSFHISQIKCHIEQLRQLLRSIDIDNGEQENITE